ncbi:MAG: NYN domain-containing protein [Pseudomonadota bacterium]
MAHIIVDGYNFIRRIPPFLEAEQEGLEQGREALLMALEEYGAQNSYWITAVFDGCGRPGFEDFELSSKDRFAGIDVMFSAKGQSADVIILGMVEKGAEDAQEMIVVTDDFELRDEAAARGAYVKSALEFFNAMEEKRPIEY